MLISRRALIKAVPVSFVSGRAFAEPFPIVAKEAKQIEYKYQRREIEFETAEAPGTIVVDPRKCFLYHVMGNGMAVRYGVSVGKAAKAWTGEVTINKMAEWPKWVPSAYHLEVMPKLAKWKDGMPGGPDNPMGARALYLYKGEVDTINRIHGAMKPGDIGKKATAGCIGMLNVHVVDLYSRVEIGTRVIML
jgi:lipoprotein-anchoring transpeptidase ErfK/SrfK